MINRFEQTLGVLTLIALGAGTLLSRFVMASTTYFLEINFSLNQYVFGSFALLCAIPLVTKRRTRLLYFTCLFPYHLYLIANIRYVYVSHLATVVPALLSVLWVALMWGILYDFARFAVKQWRLRHDSKHPSPNTG